MYVQKRNLVQVEFGINIDIIWSFSSAKSDERAVDTYQYLRTRRVWSFHIELDFEGW